MASARGLTIAFGLFAASFALHIVAGAVDLEWLFALAVVLIYATAMGFPWLAARFAGRGSLPVTFVGAAAGVALTYGTLWATNGRAHAWLEIPLAALLVGAANAVAFTVFGWGGGEGRSSPLRAGKRSA